MSFPVSVSPELTTHGLLLYPFALTFTLPDFSLFREFTLDKSLKAAMIPKIYQMANSAGKNYTIHEIFAWFILKLLDFQGIHPYFAINQVAIGWHRANIRIRMW